MAVNGSELVNLLDNIYECVRQDRDAGMYASDARKSMEHLFNYCTVEHYSSSGTDAPTRILLSTYISCGKYPIDCGIPCGSLGDYCAEGVIRGFDGYKITSLDNGFASSLVNEISGNSHILYPEREINELRKAGWVR